MCFPHLPACSRRNATLLISIFLGMSATYVHAQKSDGAQDSTEVRVPGVQDQTPKPNRRGLKPPQVFGFVQVHYRYAFATGEDSLTDYDNFRVQRVRIGVKGDIYKWVSYEVEFDPRSPSITSVLRDAYMEFKVIPRHDIRVGQQKTQFGYENVESSSNLFAVNRTEVSDNLSRGVNLRDVGVGLIGNIKTGARGFRIEDAITVVNGAGLNVQNDDTRDKNVWGRVGVRWKSDPRNFTARLGVSGARGDFIEAGDSLGVADDVRLKFTRFGVDLELDHPWFFFAAEYVGGTNEDAATGEKDDPSGYYVNLVGKTRAQVGPIVRYDTLDDDFQRWTLGGYYGLPEKPWRLMLNYEYRKLKDGERGDDKLYVWTQVRY